MIELQRRLAHDYHERQQRDAELNRQMAETAVRDDDTVDHQTAVLVGRRADGSPPHTSSGGPSARDPLELAADRGHVTEQGRPRGQQAAPRWPQSDATNVYDIKFTSLLTEQLK